MPLQELKTQANLSNKAWDKSIKCLTTHKLAKVEKQGENLVVELL
jgi:lysyl-tRNA synthetase class 2